MDPGTALSHIEEAIDTARPSGEHKAACGSSPGRCATTPKSAAMRGSCSLLSAPADVEPVMYAPGK